DPTGGYVQYQSETSAQSLNLISTVNDVVYLGSDFTSNSYDPYGYGRKSVRVESLNTYNQGLFIADFAHLPKPACGSWPAFWMYGNPSSVKGEIDIVENWNNLDYNRNTAHVANPLDIGACTISSSGMTGTVESTNCYDQAPGQYAYQGCSADITADPYGSSTGGVYALEWTDSVLQIWSWSHASTPSDVTSGKPTPSSWGTPQFAISQCNIEEAFQDLKFVFDLDFCGVAGQDAQWADSCQASTGYDLCTSYVAAEPAAFASSYFEVNSIVIYQE
ncbi:concanavalin A-like lectin/glucanase domain-containing protein, partial [Xylariales sp. PMI_506]